jgi:isoleucyl-tRNA synthetase
MSKYVTHSHSDYRKFASEILQYWDKNKIFARSIANRKDSKLGNFVFYEGPPSANGRPGIHHVMGRTIKDVFCRYKTMKGYCVPRVAGWDTHGLPIELGVEKDLGIRKDDIGQKISISEYNEKCKANVMQYTGVWEDLTKKMGYWVDMQNPYVTYEPKYMESVWWLLGKLYSKGLLYKGHTIQPYSPAAGTGLSSHELNQPGCYKMVKDTSVIAQFNLLQPEVEKLVPGYKEPIHVLAWTTTPWTLPANTALCVGPKVTYVIAKSFNRYTLKPITFVMAKDRISAYFKQEVTDSELSKLDDKSKVTAYAPIKVVSGKDLAGLKYEQLFEFVKPEGRAFEVVVDDFVTTSDGTGVVHMAPCYGADDYRIAKAFGIASLDIVDGRGRYKDFVARYAGESVKEEYLDDEVRHREGFKSTDVKLVIELKERGQAFLSEKYEHSYPHCWRTDKPILYFPLESWFVKTTALKDRMIGLNKTIRWQPTSTGTGRFGNWLENLVDWNLSRSRFWGIPLPIWMSKDGEIKVIQSIEHLKNEIDLSIKSGLMKENFLAGFVPGDMSLENYSKVDIHRTNVDRVVLVSKSGLPMNRENDIIDVWFDSGAMPYAQHHYPFENAELIDQKRDFPADFIAEGVDQTRGWFFTLHAIATLCFDSVAFKSVLSNGLVLDKNGQKMSKRLGNTVEPFEAIEKYGIDAVRWYLMANAQPWDNLKFDVDGIVEVSRKFFGTIHNTYAFFSLYANIDEFSSKQKEVPLERRSRLDRWILSELDSLINEVSAQFDDLNPTKAARAIQEFTSDKLSNWYVRLNRKRFWKGDLVEDKLAAYQTLYECLLTVVRLSAPISPMYMDRIYLDLTSGFGGGGEDSVHLADFPIFDAKRVNLSLQDEMKMAMNLSSLVLSLREKANIRVRQPLQKIMVPILSEAQRSLVESVKEFILSETNIKEIVYLSADSDLLVKKIKANFKTLGKKIGKLMKPAAERIAQMTALEIQAIERGQSITMDISGEAISIEPEDVEISFAEVEGLLIGSQLGITVAMDTVISKSLKLEGAARELVNRIQNLRKDRDFEVTDRIQLKVMTHPIISDAMKSFGSHISEETLVDRYEVVDKMPPDSVAVLFDDVSTSIWIERSRP